MQLLSLSIDTLDRPGLQGICPLAPVPHWVRALPGEMNDLYDADISQYDISSSSAQMPLCWSSFWHLLKIPALWKLYTLKCLKRFLKVKQLYTIGTPQWWGWPFCLLLLFPSSFSLAPSAIHVRVLAWAFSIYACFICEPHSPCWLVCFSNCCIDVILRDKCLVINTVFLSLSHIFLPFCTFIFILGLSLLVSFLNHHLSTFSLCFFPLLCSLSLLLKMMPLIK